MSNVQIQEQGKFFIIRFPYRPWITKMAQKIPGKRFMKIGEDKFWRIPIEQREMVEKFANTTKAQWVMNGQVNDTVVEIPVILPLPELTQEIPLKRTLRHYQRSGVAYMMQKKKVLCGDQMGTGKSSQAIATIEGAQSFPCLIICPSTLKLNWQDEIEATTIDSQSLILCDKVRHNFQFYYETGLAKYFIVNFESLKKYFVESIDDPGKNKSFKLKDVHFKASISMFKSVIIDESHRVKSLTTQMAIFAAGIAIDKEYRIGLTGTPVVSRPKDLISQLAILGLLEQFGGKKSFEERYCSGPKEASHLTELNARLCQIGFFRRLTTDVVEELPAKSRQVVKCEIATRKEYEDAEANLELYLKEYRNATDAAIRKSMRGRVMVLITVLKNISARGKIASMADLVNDVLESGEKLVLFAHLKEVVEGLKKEFPDAVTITGSDSESARDTAKKKFQNDDSCKLIICSIKAAGVGITLTASKHVSFIELPWTFADCEQAESRLHRIGQKENVLCTYLLGHNTIDEWIYSIIIEKKHIAHTITGTEEDVEESIVDAIADLFSRKEKVVI